MSYQMNIFDILGIGHKKYVIDKPIAFTSFFTGYGSFEIALKYLGVDFESVRTCEWCVPSIQAYKDIHYPNVNTDYSNGYSLNQIVEYLVKMGISTDYNTPMTKNKIIKKGEKWCRQVFNNICTNKNLVNIQNVNANQLVIKSDKCNILTYSFPCQDLSLAGKLAGMTKGDNTRSGLLWEVERLLWQLHNEQNKHYDLLIMENVTQVHGSRNKDDFKSWCNSLEKLGYSNFWQDLNACNYKIPQNRNRCFMVSIYDPNHEYDFDFPKEMELDIRLEHILEHNVDESYYLSDEMVERATTTEFSQGKLENRLPEKESGGGTLVEPYSQEIIKTPKLVECP